MIRNQKCPKKAAHEVSQNWAPDLSCADAIAAYVETYSSDDVSTEMIEEQFSGCCAKLELVPISAIREGDADSNIGCKKKQKKYDGLPAETMPPILIEDGVIQDGHHRYRSAVARGSVEMWCYVVSPTPEPAEEIREHLFVRPKM